MNKSYIEWIDYYENATKEDVIQDMMLDINSIKEKNKEIERLNNIINEVKDYIRSKSIKFTMAYVEDDGRIDLSRSEYRIDKLTSKQVKELLGILDKENDNGER